MVSTEEQFEIDRVAKTGGIFTNPVMRSQC